MKKITSLRNLGLMTDALHARYPYIPAADIRLVVEIIIDSWRQTLKQQGRVELRGFGVFWVVQRAAATSVNPHNGMPLSVPALRVIRFRPSSALLDKLETTHEAQHREHTEQEQGHDLPSSPRLIAVP